MNIWYGGLATHTHPGIHVNDVSISDSPCFWLVATKEDGSMAVDQREGEVDTGRWAGPCGDRGGPVACMGRDERRKGGREGGREGGRREGGREGGRRGIKAGEERERKGGRGASLTKINSSFLE